MHKKWEWWVHDGCYHILLYVTAFMFLWAILSPEILLQQCDHSLPVQSCCSVAKSRPTLCNPMNCSTPGFSVHPSLPEFAQTYVHWAGDAIQPSHPPLPPSPPALNLARQQGLFHESALHIRRPEYWSFSFSISPSNEHSELISFRIDWFDLLAVQRTLKSLLQHNSKASVLHHSGFFV